MGFISNHKKEILIGVITGIIVLVITPLLNFVGEFFVQLFLIISDTFSKLYYSSIAINHEEGFSEWNNFILLYFFTLIFMGLCFYAWTNKLRVQASISVMEISESLEGKDNYSGKVHNPSILEYDNRISKLRQEAKFYNRNFTIVIFVTIFMGIMLFSDYTFRTSVANQNLAFKNDLIKIKPYVENLEIDKMKSDWARMKTANQFEKIQSQMDSIKTELNIE